MIKRKRKFPPLITSGSSRLRFFRFNRKQMVNFLPLKTSATELFTPMSQLDQPPTLIISFLCYFLPRPFKPQFKHWRPSSCVDLATITFSLSIVLLRYPETSENSEYAVQFFKKQPILYVQLYLHSSL